MAKRRQRLSDYTAYEGEGAGHRIGRDFDNLLEAVSELEESVDETDNNRIPRVNSIQGTSDPRVIKASESGTLFTDVPATAATGFRLPPASSLSVADRRDWCLHYYFVNTSGKSMTITVGDTTNDTIEVGPVAGGATSFTLSQSNDTLHLALIDDRWRAI